MMFIWAQPELKGQCIYSILTFMVFYHFYFYFILKERSITQVTFHTVARSLGLNKWDSCGA